MSQVANRYAEAFYSLVLSENKVEEYKNDIDLVKSALDGVEGIKEFLASVKVGKEEKKKVLKDCLEGKVSKYTLNFLYVLVDKNRAVKYPEIFKEFRHLCNLELGIKEGVIESARPLDETKIKELEETLSKDGQKVELINKIDKTLISGFRVVFENEIIDGSMKEKIKKMNDMLLRKDVSLWN